MENNVRDLRTSDVRISVGANIRRGRQRAGMSLRELGRRLGLSPASLSAIENGKTEVGLERLGKIGGLLGLSLAELLPSDLVRPDRPAHSAAQSHPSDARALDDWRRFGPLGFDVVLSAALDGFLAVGYHGCSTRDIAQRAGLSVASLYHYYDNKQSMLVTLLDLTMDDLLRRARLARDEGKTPAERFALLVESIVLYHTLRPGPAFIGSSEMRSLEPENRARIADKRIKQQRMVDVEVLASVSDGTFTTTRPQEASRAVVTMCIAVAQWYDPRGSLSPADVAKDYIRFALDLVKCVPPCYLDD
jgi:TetR/AcrR family transcriptional regulator, cholesterol catabolism regulator